MRGAGRIARWEILRNLRNKQFLIGLFLMPAIMIIFAGAPSLIARFDSPRREVYLVVDRIGAAQALQQSLAESAIELLLADGVEGLDGRLRSGEADGYFELDADFMRTGVVEVVLADLRRTPGPDLRGALSEILSALRMAEAGIDPLLMAELTMPAAIQPVALEPEDTAPMRDMLTALIALSVLGVLVFNSGPMLLQSAMQEKRDRMGEIVLSSIGPSELMAGKLLGQFILGIIQVGAWAAVAFPIAIFLLDANVGEWISWRLLPLLTVFFLLGYLFFAAIFVGMGATIEDLQSAGNAQGMVFMIPFASVLFFGPVFVNPDGLLARVGTFLPIVSPAVVIMRAGLTVVPPWEALVAGAALLAATALVTALAAKLFRVGMLMYGKNATPAEIWRWLRHG